MGSLEFQRQNVKPERSNSSDLDNLIPGKPSKTPFTPLISIVLKRLTPFTAVDPRPIYSRSLVIQHTTAVDKEDRRMIHFRKNKSDKYVCLDTKFSR